MDGQTTILSQITEGVKGIYGLAAEGFNGHYWRCN